MTQEFRLTLAQLNPTVGDLAGNLSRALDAWGEAARAGADMLALPEMFITGYQTQDLVTKPAFYSDAADHIDKLRAATEKGGPAIAIGTIKGSGSALCASRNAPL